MFGCYGIFLGGLLYASGRVREALFMIAISTAYTILSFRLSGALIRPDGHGAHHKRMVAGSKLATWTSPVSHGAPRTCLLFREVAAFPWRAGE